MNELLRIKSIVGFSLDKDYFGKINFSALGDNPNPVIRKIFLREEKSLNFAQLQNRASSILAKGSIFALHLNKYPRHLLASDMSLLIIHQNYIK